jgi:hypothetical protein
MFWIFIGIKGVDGQWLHLSSRPTSLSLDLSLSGPLSR